MTDPDELYQRDPPPAWKRSASDLSTPVAASLAKPASPGPLSASGGAGGVLGNPPRAGAAQSPGNTGVASPLVMSPAPVLSPVPFVGFPKSPANVTVESSHIGTVFPSPTPPKPHPVASGRGEADTKSEAAVRSQAEKREGDAFGFRAAIPSVALQSPSPFAGTTSRAVTLPAQLPERAGTFGAPGPSEAKETTGREHHSGVSLRKTDTAPRASWTETEAAQETQVGTDGTGRALPKQAEGQLAAGLGNLQGFVGSEGRSDAAGGVPDGALGSPSIRSPAVEAPLAAIGEESAVTGNGGLEGGREAANPPGADELEQLGKVGDAGKEPQGGKTGILDGGAAGSATHPPARDPFPLVTQEPTSQALAHSSPKDPSDPWDLVAQRATPFPKPAVPEAFRNGPPEQPGSSSPMGGASSLAEKARPEPNRVPVPPNGKADGNLEREGSFGSERSVGSVDSGADVAEGVAGNRKALVLDYGKKIGASFRERGRKYLEKGRLGTLLHRADGGGVDGQPQQRS